MPAPYANSSSIRDRGGKDDYFTFVKEYKANGGPLWAECGNDEAIIESVEWFRTLLHEDGVPLEMRRSGSDERWILVWRKD